MTKNYGIKVSRSGFDVKTARPNELAFSSAYKTLKVHSFGSGSITDSSRIVTIPHNLGYVPIFMVHTTMDKTIAGNLFSSGDYVLTPAGTGSLLADPSIGENNDLFAYADATNLYIKAQSNWGKVLQYMSSGNDMYSDAFDTTDSFLVGKSVIFGAMRGAIRFPSVAIAQGISVASAILHIYFWEKGSSSSNLKYILKGIDEDNTANFSGGDPFGRPTTSAQTTAEASVPSAPSEINFDVKSMLEEINSRGGWSYGNAMAFTIEDNSSPDNVWIHSNYSGYETRSYLDILLNNTVASYKYTIFKNQLE